MAETKVRSRRSPSKEIVPPEDTSVDKADRPDIFAEPVTFSAAFPETVAKVASRSPPTVRSSEPSFTSTLFKSRSFVSIRSALLAETKVRSRRSPSREVVPPEDTSVDKADRLDAVSEPPLDMLRSPPALRRDIPAEPVTFSAAFPETVATVASRSPPTVRSSEPSFTSTLFKSRSFVSLTFMFPAKFKSAVNSRKSVEMSREPE